MHAVSDTHAMSGTCVASGTHAVPDKFVLKSPASVVYWGQTDMNQTKSTRIKEVSPHQVMFSGFPGRPALFFFLTEEELIWGRGEVGERSGRSRGREHSVGT